MKVKLKDNIRSLPNCWKQGGVGKKDWDKLQEGNEIEVNSVPESINSLVEVTASSNKKEGDK